MLFRLFHGIPLHNHIALWPDHHGGTDRSLHFLAVHHLLAKRGVFFHDLGSRVGQQNVGQIVFLGELVVRWDAIFADT